MITHLLVIAAFTVVTGWGGFVAAKRWPRPARWAVALSSAAVGAVASLLAEALYYDADARANPRVQTALQGVPLNATRGELLFLTGFYAEHSRACSEMAYKEKFLGNTGPTLRVTFVGDLATIIEYGARGAGLLSPTLHGYGIGATHEEVVRGVNSPSTVVAAPDGVEALIVLTDLNSFYRTRGGRVIAFGIFSRAHGEPTFASCT